MTKVTPLLLAILMSLNAGAQGVFSNTTNAALKMVIEDYPNHFNNIKEIEYLHTSLPLTINQRSSFRDR